MVELFKRIISLVVLFAPCWRMGQGYQGSCLPNAVPPAERRNITIDSATMPLGIWVLGWPSATQNADVFKIVAEEVLGYNTVRHGYDGIVESGMWALAGCAGGGVGDMPASGCLLDTARARSVSHVVFETFDYYLYSAIDRIQTDFPTRMPLNLGSVGYDGLEANFVSSKVIREGLEHSGLGLNFYGNYNASWFEPSLFFDSIFQINDTVHRMTTLGWEKCSTMSPTNDAAAMQDYIGFFGDIGGTQTVAGQLRGRCTDDDVWWISPACRHNLTLCVPYVTYAAWGVVGIMHKAAAFNIPIATANVADFDEWIAVVRAVDTMTYWWVPDSSFIDMDMQITMFPPFNADEHARGYLVSEFTTVKLEKWAHPGLEAAAKKVFDTVRAMQISLSQMEAMLLKQKTDSATSEDVACEFLLTQANYNAWIPNEQACFVGQGLASNSTSAACEWCPPATRSVVHPSIQDARLCAQCTAGSFQNELGQSECSECSTGRFSNDGAVECSSCELGTFMEATGASECTPCPSGYTTAFPGATRMEMCVCPAGTYRDSEAWEACRPCPGGMICETGSDLRSFPWMPTTHCAGEVCTHPVAQPGHMALVENPLTAYRCMPPTRCPGGDPGTCGPLQDSHKVSCGECADGAYEGGEGACEPCGDGPNEFLIVILIVAAFVAVVVITFAVNRDVLVQPNSVTTAVLLVGLTVSAIQTLSIFQSLRIEWQEPLKSMLKVVSTISFDFKFLKFECFMGVGLVGSYVGRQVVAPCTLPVIFGVLMFKKIRLMPNMTVWVEWVNTVGTIFMIFFISVIISATTPMICYKHPGDAGESMLAGPSLLCFDSQRHWTMVGVGIAAFMFVPVPFFVICIICTLSYPSFITRADKNHMLRAFRFLFFRFKPVSYYYGCALLGRNLCICLVPVVVRDNAALQVMLTSFLLLASMLLQTLLQPWRTTLPNIVDGAINGMLVLMLLVGTLSSDVAVDLDTLNALGVIVVCLFVAVPVATIAYTVADQLKPRPFYHYFICHHKAGATAQARLLQLLIRSKTNRSCFIDSDDLTDLSVLFDIVSSRLDRFIVYLTAKTLSRSWCAGEIVTAHRSGKKLSVIMQDSFSPPTEEEFTDLGSYLDVSSVNLVEYNITLGDVSDAFRWLLSKPADALRIDGMRGRMLFERAATAVISQGGSEKQESPKSSSLPDQPDMLLVSTDLEDDEATAAGAVLVFKIQASLLEKAKGGVCFLADYVTPERMDLCTCVARAYTVVVVLTAHSLSSSSQIEVIMAALIATDQLDNFGLLPVSTPSFTFPSATYYTVELPRIWPGNPEKPTAALREFFNRVSVAFSTHASDSILATQAKEVFNRLPAAVGNSARNLYKDVAKSASLNIETSWSAGKPETKAFDSDEHPSIQQDLESTAKQIVEPSPGTAPPARLSKAEVEADITDPQTRTASLGYTLNV